MIILNSAVAYLALGATLLLGLYLVTRSPRRATAWLAAGTLWALSGYFLNRLINLNVTTYGGIASLGAMSAIWPRRCSSACPRGCAGRQVAGDSPCGPATGWPPSSAF